MQDFKTATPALLENPENWAKEMANMPNFAAPIPPSPFLSSKVPNLYTEKQNLPPSKIQAVNKNPFWEQYKKEDENKFPYKITFGKNLLGKTYLTITQPNQLHTSKPPIPREGSQLLRPLNAKNKRKIRQSCEVIDKFKDENYTPKFITLTMPFQIPFDQMTAAKNQFLKTLKDRFLRTKINEFIYNEYPYFEKVGLNRFKERHPEHYENFVTQWVYVWVKELQVKRYQSTGQAVLHFHICANLPFIKYKDINAIWCNAIARQIKAKQPISLQAAKFLSSAIVPYASPYIRTEIAAVETTVAGYMSKYLQKYLSEDDLPKIQVGDLYGISRSISTQLKMKVQAFEYRGNPKDITTHFISIAARLNANPNNYTHITFGEYCTRIDSNTDAIKDYLIQLAGRKMCRWNNKRHLEIYPSFKKWTKERLEKLIKWKSLQPEKYEYPNAADLVGNLVKFCPMPNLKPYQRQKIKSEQISMAFGFSDKRNP